MGQEQGGVSPREPSPAGLERDITEIRSKLDTELLELDRRRHQLVEPMKGPATRLVLGAGVLVIGGGLALAVWNSHRKAQRSQLEALAARISRALEKAPPEPAQGSHFGLFTLAAAFAAGVLASRGGGSSRRRMK
jgi:hypothetical protein